MTSFRTSRLATWLMLAAFSSLWLSAQTTQALAPAQASAPTTSATANQAPSAPAGNEGRILGSTITPSAGSQSKVVSSPGGRDGKIIGSTLTSPSASSQQESLGDAARRLRKHKRHHRKVRRLT